jgi:dTDP-4-dehydrorhamnose reductase
MKALITGIHGTVGNALNQYLQSEGCETVGWDRDKVPVLDYYRMEAFIRETAPDLFFHLAIASKPAGLENESWKINYEWPSELAWITRLLHIPFLVTSTAMVFGDNTPPPLSMETIPNAESGYGYEKRRMEERVLFQNPDARIVRLGWQIGTSSGSNHMVDYLEKEQRDKGCIEASTRWYPACSFLDDTVPVLLDVLTRKPPGIYMADSNLKWSFYEIAVALNEKLKKNWKVLPSERFVFDQRLVDPRIIMPDLKRRLKNLH